MKILLATLEAERLVNLEVDSASVTANKLVNRKMHKAMNIDYVRIVLPPDSSDKFDQVFEFALFLVPLMNLV